MGTHEVHAGVQRLVHLVARCFYGDEHFVVLDCLCREPFLREDKLDGVARYLSSKYIKRILEGLVEQQLVCKTQLSEGRKRPRAAAPAAAEEEAVGGEDNDDGDDEDATRAPTAVCTVNVAVYYLNPQRFVDAVECRVRAVESHFDMLAKRSGGPCFQCGTCRRTFEEWAAIQASMRCPCNGAALAPHVEHAAQAAGHLSASFCFQMDASGIRAQLDTLKGEHLGSNHPDAHIAAGTVTLLGQHSSTLQEQLLGTYRLPKQTIELVDERVDYSSGAGGGAPAWSVVADQAVVAFAAVPVEEPVAKDDPAVLVAGTYKKLSEIVAADEELMSPDEYEVYWQLCL